MKYKVIDALIFTGFFALLIINYGCRKGFLDKKPNSNLLQPKTLSDFQQLLENENICNRTAALPQLSSDEYFIPSLNNFQLVVENTAKNSAIWEKDIYQGEINILDWNVSWQAAFYANAVIEGMQKMTPDFITNDDLYNNILGWAYFIRGHSFYDLVRNFSPAYDEVSAEIDLGIPLKLTANIDEIVQRSSVKMSYDQILSDLNNAALLLGENVQVTNRNRPSKPSAYALLARVYLSMRQYDKSLLYADSCLSLYNTLIDYNNGISLTSTTPFSDNASEVLFSTRQVFAYTSLIAIGTSGRNYRVDTNLIKNYTPNDLRLSIFFVKNTDGLYNMKRSYIGSGNYQFTGLATDEVYLIKAECLARLGFINEAMSTLNNLLIKRFKTGTFVPISASTQADAINKILVERKKELVWRSLRWDDLKRLNKEGANITLSRTIGSTTYEISPNSPKYVFPIPENEIALSNIEQNIR